MTVLDVYLNERKLCRAGVGADGVLNAIVSWVRLTGDAAANARRLEKPLEEARLHVGGLADDTHRSWSDRMLAPDDRVLIVLARASRADRPSRIKRRDVERDERAERRYYERLKQKYEPSGDVGSGDGSTRFLNVDLDIWSRSPLDALVKAFGKKVYTLHVGKQGRRYRASLEMAAEFRSPDLLVRRFVEQVERLPRAARQMWNRAQSREFNLGIQAAANPYSFELRLEPETIRAAASVNARIGMTIYGARLSRS